MQDCSVGQRDQANNVGASVRKNLDIIVWSSTISSTFVIGLLAVTLDGRIWTDQVWAGGLYTLASLVTAGATVVLAIGVWFAWKTLGIQEDQKYAEGLFHMHQILMTPDFVKARRYMRTNRQRLREKKVEDWCSEDLQNADLVCASYDQAGVLTKAGLLSKKNRDEFFGSSWGDSIVDQYEGLAPYLDAEAAGGQPYRAFFRHFGELYATSKNQKP
jgi:hypothetical protein